MTNLIGVGYTRTIDAIFLQCFILHIASASLRLQPLRDSLSQNDHGFFVTRLHCQVQRGFAVFAFRT